MLTEILRTLKVKLLVLRAKELLSVIKCLLPWGAAESSQVPVLLGLTVDNSIFLLYTLKDKLRLLPLQLRFPRRCFPLLPVVVLEEDFLLALNV